MERREFIRKTLVLTAAGELTVRGVLAADASVQTHSAFAGISIDAARGLEDANLARATAVIDADIARGPFKPTWESLHAHADPEWFRDAKFGIYTHWGPVTVGSTDSGAEWYGNQMYQPEQPAFKWHQDHFGDQHTVGFKDVIPHLTAEKFDADEWADIVARSGARFAGPVAAHHDRFAMWDSAITRWNSVNMGPHRDIVGDLAKAYRKRGLRFITSFHHGFAWRYYEPSFDYDGGDPNDADLYTTPHAKGAPPSKLFQDQWLAEVHEVLEKYQPDLIYFDFEFTAVITPEYQQRLFAAAYNWADQNQRDIAVTQKDRGVHAHTGILDFERGREDRLTPYPWLTDTALGSWFYVESAGFRPAGSTIGILVDIVSKNGCMMLDVGPKIDGTLPQKGVDVLLGIGQWLKTNGEAIYETRPWLTFGEGPTRNGGGGFSEGAEKPYTAADLRFTRSKDGKTVYVIAMDWPKDPVTVRSMRVDALDPDAHVDLLGGGPATFHLNDNKQLIIEPPSKQIGDHAFAFKLSGLHISLSEDARFDQPGARHLEPDLATLDGSKIRTQVNENRPNIGAWDDPTESIHWLVSIPRAGRYAVRGEFSSAYGATSLKLTMEEQTLTAAVPQTDGWFKPEFVTFGELKFPRQGVYHLALAPADVANWRAVNVYGLALAPLDEQASPSV